MTTTASSLRPRSEPSLLGVSPAGLGAPVARDDGITAKKKAPQEGPLVDRKSDQGSDESVDGVVDLVVGDGAGVASDAVISLDAMC
ncbi:MAG: hypothetical protein WCI65_11965 [Synechococcaceae cyanobacterium ELA263]